MYLDFSQYHAMGGALAETDYSRYEYKARKAIDKATFARLAAEVKISECVKRLMYELIGAFNEYDNQPSLVSFSNDGMSGTYKATTAAEFSNFTDTLINTYLEEETTKTGCPLLYRGRKDGETV